FDEFKAVMIFFSDGQPQDIELGIAMAQHIRSTYAKYDLKAFAVGFGRVNLSVLQRVASEMGGEYRQVLGANALRTEFQRIAAVLCNNEASLALVESDMEVSVDDKDNRFSDERGCDQDRIERINPNFPTGRKRFGPSGSMARKKARSGALVADKCFRLLQLKREVQDDARVMKAVMDEVNVLHLCRALGMAVADESDKSSMNKFDFGHFDPSSYDADFARFIRGKLIEVGGSNAQLDGDQKREDQLRVGCLFGKQMEVKAELVRMGIWTSACESRVQDQGVYCLEHGDESSDGRQFVVFVWLNAGLVEPENVRDTPTYMLRFLMSLSSNITCCMSQDDFKHVESEVAAAVNSSNNVAVVLRCIPSAKARGAKRHNLLR
ncbi:hypothetical protein PF005_g27040, partial [Phytophthora fragariae]